MPSLLQLFEQQASSSGLYYQPADQMEKELQAVGMSQADINNVIKQLGSTGTDGAPIKASGTTTKDILNGIYAEGLAITGNANKAAQFFQAVLAPYGLNAADFAASGTTYNKFVSAFGRVVTLAQQPEYGGRLGKIPAGALNLAGTTSTLSKADQLIAQGVAGIPGAIETMAAAQSTASAKISADSTLQSTLASWGLDSMSGLIDQWVFKDGITNSKELMNMVRSYKDPKTGVSPYDQAFPGLKQQQATAAANNTKPLDEATYLTLTNSYQQTAQAAGLPAGFLSPKELTNLVSGNVSASEFSRRIADGYNAVAALPQNIQDQFAQQHGIGTGGLLAYFLDPTKAEGTLEKQALGANLQYTGQAAGLTNFTGQQAQDLGEMVRVAASTGAATDPYSQFTLGKAQQALQTASKDVQLTGNTPGSGAPTVDTQTLIGAQIAGFEGTNLQAAQTAAERAAQAKAAPFQKGGGYAESAKGVTGIGSAAI